MTLPAMICLRCYGISNVMDGASQALNQGVLQLARGLPNDSNSGLADWFCCIVFERFPWNLYSDGAAVLAAIRPGV